MTEEKECSLDAVLDGFELNALEKPKLANKRTAITIWLEPEMGQRYNEIQVKSAKQFHKVLREIIIRAIEKVDKAS